MTGKGIEIDIAANARDFQKGTKDVESALEDVADALDDITKDADKAGDKIGDELSDGAKDAEQSVEKLERKFKDVADASKRETGRAGDAMKKNTKDATTAAQRDLGELKDEAVQNASETFSSFDGSMSSFADGIQGTFGGIVSSMGPVGAAAGAAGAIGIGLMMKAFDDAEVDNEEFREQVRALAEELIETGKSGKVSLGYIADGIKELALESEDGKKSLADIAKEAEKMGVPLEGLAQAYAGVGDNLDEYVDRAEKAGEAAKDQAREATRGARGQGIAVEQVGRSYGDMRKSIEKVQKQQKEAEETERLWHESGGAALEARGEQMDALQDELDDVIGSWKDYTDAETGATDPAKYIANMQARRDATSNFNDNVQQLAEQFGLSFEETQAILDQGVDFAPMLQAIIDGGPEMQRQYADQMRATVDGGQAILDGTDTSTTVTVKGDTAQAEKQLKKTAEPRDTEVKADAETRAASRELTTFTNRKRRATVDVGVNTAAAERALTRFINRKRTATITVEARDREGKYVP